MRTALVASILLLVAATAVQAQEPVPVQLGACLQITGATRGLYVSSRNGRMRCRAALDVDGYPRAEPSEFDALSIHTLVLV